MFLTLTSNRITKTLFLHRLTAHLSFAHKNWHTKVIFIVKCRLSSHENFKQKPDHLSPLRIRFIRHGPMALPCCGAQTDQTAAESPTAPDVLKLLLRRFGVTEWMRIIFRVQTLDLLKLFFTRFYFSIADFFYAKFRLVFLHCRFLINRDIWSRDWNCTQ